jgi:hypothetical protein
MMNVKRKADIEQLLAVMSHGLLAWWKEQFLLMAHTVYVFNEGDE